MSATDTVHRLLFQALLEMRSQGHDVRNKVVFRLADLFHNVVLEMERAASGDGSYEEVLCLLEEQAREKGCDKWLAQQLEHLTKKSAPTPPIPADQSTGDPLQATEPA